MRHQNTEEWEARLRSAFDRVDDYLEEKYGDRYSPHPSRPERGTTASKEQDGLFYVGASFSVGADSEHGPGYVVNLKPVTLEKIPKAELDEMERAMVRILEEELPLRFPGRGLKVSRDGHVLKIHGDLGFD
jgi:hypothetical protein